MTSRTLHVLLVEDSLADAKLVMRAIRGAGHDVEFERVQDAGALHAALDRKDWDLVISDWSMPTFDALGALSVVKEHGIDLPFIIVSGTVGEELAVEAMRAGAHDYVLKDKLARLAPLVERELRERKAREAQRLAERALRASEARFARLAQSGVIGIVSGDIAGSILEANDAFLKIVGFTREELRAGAVRWRDITAPESSDDKEQAFEELRATGVAMPHEKEYVRKDGTRVPVLAGVAMVDDVSSIAFMVDLTAQKRAEDALRRTEDQFRQAQKMEAVGRLAAGIAHDFNNLLSVILSYSAMLVAELPVGDPTREDIAEIAEAGRRAAELTRQLLVFSRQEVVEPKVLDLNDVLKSLSKMLPRLLGEDVELASVREASLGRVRIDAGHLEQVIMNLTVNARDAMPTGGKITIETANVVFDRVYSNLHHGVAPGPYVMLAVSDTGCGMDKATQSRAFEPFFTTKHRGKGTGLGLSTVFGIVSQCGGSIGIESEIGRGSTFKVYLPRVDAELDSLRLVSAPATLQGTETILLVEDDGAVRAVAVGILRRNGYNVIEARNGSEALLATETRAEPIDLLLSDVVMPHMSGPELAKRVLVMCPTVKVLCMSGYTDDAIVRHGALEAGIAFLPKPFTPQTLAGKVRAVLDS